MSVCADSEDGQQAAPEPGRGLEPAVELGQLVAHHVGKLRRALIEGAADLSEGEPDAA